MYQLEISQKHSDGLICSGMGKCFFNLGWEGDSLFSYFSSTTSFGLVLVFVKFTFGLLYLYQIKNFFFQFTLSTCISIANGSGSLIFPQFLKP